MAEPLSDEALAQIRARDEAAGDGWTVADSLVWQDRHDLLQEVDRLRDQLRSTDTDGASDR